MVREFVELPNGGGDVVCTGMGRVCIGELLWYEFGGSVQGKLQ